MAIFIFHLPRELCTLILNQLPEQTLFHLSTTCQAYRNELAPRLFRTIRLRNSAKSANSALLAASKFGQLTEKLIFEHEISEYEDCAPVLTLPVLLPATRNLLRGHALPNLQAIELELQARNITYHDRMDQVLRLFSKSEHPAETADAEENHEWRALLNEAYAAISKNITISRLEIDEFLPINVSALYSRSFRRFLGRLESATICLSSPRSYGGHTQVLDYKAYTDFVANLAHVFFHQMKNLQSLELRAGPGFPLGGVWATSIVLALPPESLPRLTSLKLENCHLNSHLLEFIKAHKDTLCHVVLEDCAADFSGYKGDLEYPLLQETWAYFLFEILKLQSSVLVQFDVKYSDLLLVELFMDGEPTEFDDVLEFKAASQAAESLADSLMADTSKKIFAYATFQPKYEHQIVQRYINRMQATQCKDAIAYQQLQRLMKSNANRLLRESRNLVTS